MLAVADVWEALTAERPYRAAMDPEAAMEIVAADRGVGLCPAAVAGLEATLADEPEFTATVGATLGDHEGLRPAVRRPA